ncbi:MAG: PKHD-type hydroxylase [Paraglaciecola sp.]|jgi:PKHD-type hydroxylase
MTTFLSDPDTYEGGELVIQTEFGEQRIKGQGGMQCYINQVACIG